jgi:hypothetical protein
MIAQAIPGWKGGERATKPVTSMQVEPRRNQDYSEIDKSCRGLWISAFLGITLFNATSA